MKKSGFIISLLSSIVFLSTNVAAQSNNYASIFQNAFSTITGVLQGAVGALIAIPTNILMFLLVFTMLYWSALKIFHEKTYAFLVSIIVSLIGMSVFWTNNGAEWLSMITTSYSAVAITLLIILPMVLFWYFSLSFVATPLFTPMWLVAAVCFFLLSAGKLSSSPASQDSAFAWLAMFAGFASLIVMFAKGRIKVYRINQLSAIAITCEDLINDARGKVSSTDPNITLEERRELREKIKEWGNERRAALALIAQLNMP